MKFEVEGDSQFNLYFRNADKIILGWECSPEYQPDSRVTMAWGFALDDLKISVAFQDMCSVILQTWPPKTPI